MTVLLLRCYGVKPCSAILLRKMSDEKSRKQSKEEEPCVTLEAQFPEFARLLDPARSGQTITLYNSDYWMRQSKVIDDRKVTMTDTGIAWAKFGKTELNWNEWNEFLKVFCAQKELDQKSVEDDMSNCGLPGFILVYVPEYKDFFRTYKPKNRLVY